MGKHRFARTTARFADAPRSPCLYVAELIRPDAIWIKFGVGGNALGRMMSLRAEVKRVHCAELGRIAIFTVGTAKAAYEAETKVVKSVGLLVSPIEGRREFFHGISFDHAWHVASKKTGLHPIFDYGEQIRLAA